jgi:thiosulfate sulfurtransferase
MKIGIIAAGIILILGYAGNSAKLRAQEMGSAARSEHREQEMGSAARSEHRAQGAGQSVADTIVAVDPDKVRLEASLDPSVIIIDVRMKMEYRRGHIEKAVHLPNKKSLLEFAARTAVSRPLYLYCTTETRSRQAAKLLVNAGFERVFIIEGGFNKWKAYGLPVEKR